MLNPAVNSVSSGAVDLALIHRLTNLNDINRILHETIAKERSIENELDQLLGKRVDLERSFLLLNTPTAETLELVHADCEQLLAGVQGTAQLATRISSKVRTLDLAQTRVQDALGKIKAILDRTNCINGVQAAMEAEDFEAAANYIGTFFELEAKMSVHSSQYALAVDDGQEDAQRQVLLQARTKLEEVVDKQLEEAVARRDQIAVLRFAKLYKPLGKQAEGLRRFVEFMRLSVAGRARTLYTQVAEQLDADKKVDFHAAVSALFKDLALALEEHEGFVREAFGSAGVLEAASGLQAECDTHGARLLARFAEARRVDRMVSEVRGRKRPVGAASGAGAAGGKDGGPDPRQVDVLLQELLRLCQLAEEYNQFMLGKMREGGQLTTARETSFRSGPFNIAVRELLGQYMALEEFYMNATCSLAVTIDEVPPQALTSSLVDDVFFILRKCGMRALASGSVQCCAALLAELNNVVANTLRDALAARLAPGPARLLAAAPAADSPGGMAAVAGPAAAGATEHCVALNNSDVSSEYVVKLRTELEGYLSSSLPGSTDRDRLRAVLSDLAKSALDLRQAHTRALEQLAEAIVPRFRPVLDEVAAVSYLLSDSEYSNREAEDGWANHLLAALQLLLLWLQPLLTSNNYEVLLHLLLDKMVARLEAVIARKQFSQLGGLQLERDARLLLSGLQELTTRTVRDKLARLSQMALLLGLESVDEVLDYWTPGAGGAGGGEAGGAGITWRLSAAEVRAVLLQRGDLSRDAVMALPL